MAEPSQQLRTTVNLTLRLRLCCS